MQLNNNEEFDKYGINKHTWTKYDKRWFDKNWEHETWSLWDINGFDVEWKYNPIFDSKRKSKRDAVCHRCDGLWEISKRSSLHQFSEDQNYKIICPLCLWSGGKKT